MTALWTSEDAVAATGGTTACAWQANGVSIDTRTLQRGDLFVALKAVRDGHDFVAQALSGGAAAALVTHRPDGVPEDAPLLIVPDVLTALEDMGRFARARTQAKVAAITGSVGKTSTKDMLAAALAPQGKVHAAVASYNNHWGVPLTLARMPADTDYAVIEIGMSAPGEIAPLARLARPHVAMVTTVAAAHLEAFDSLDGIAVEKGSIFQGLEPGGVAVLNGDLPTTPTLRAAAQGAARALTFGAGPGNHHRLLSAEVRKGQTVATARGWRVPLLYKVASEGAHFATNALGVLAVCWALGADRTRSIMGLSQWRPPAGRGARETLSLDPATPSETFELIDDAFNANPTSMTAALRVLALADPQDGVGRVGKGRRIAILGDMLELGPDEIAMHQQVAQDPSLANVHVVHCVGPRMKALYEALPSRQRGRWVDTAQALAKAPNRLVDAGDVILVKGSKGSRVSLVVDAIRKLGHPRPDPDIEAP